MKTLRIFVAVLFTLAFLLADQKIYAQNVNCAVKATGIQISQSREGKSCYAPNSCIAGGSVQVTVIGIDTSNQEYHSPTSLRIVANGPELFNKQCIANITGDSASCDLDVSGSNNGAIYSITAQYNLNTNVTCRLSTGKITVNNSCADTSCIEDPSLITENTYKICMQIPSTGTGRERCIACEENNGIWTAIGCIPTSPEAVTKTLVTIGLSLAGTVVLIMILAGSFMLSTSQGDPNKTKEAKEMITSAIIGLLFIVFSITILQYIGVSILHIPGFGE